MMKSKLHTQNLTATMRSECIHTEFYKIPHKVILLIVATTKHCCTYILIL